MSTLNLKIQLKAFDKVSAKFENIRKTAGKLGKNFDANTKQLASLQKKINNVSAYQKQKTAISTTAEKLKFLQQAGKSSSAQYKKLQETLQQQSQKFLKLSDSLKKAKISTKNLSQEEIKLKEKAFNVNKVLSDQALKLDKIAAKNRKAAKASKAFSSSMQKAQAMSVAGYAGLATGRKIGGGLANMMLPGIGFEKQMSRVGAIAKLDKNSSGFKSLKDSAKNLGASTSFSASQVASGQEFLAMAGLSEKHILAAMPDMLSLAKVAGMDNDLAGVADIASNVLSAFKLPGNEMVRVSDVFAQAITSANVDVRMLGDTMKYVAPAAAAVGASIEETTAMAGLLGNIGIQGESAGSSLRNLYNRLSSPPKAANDALEQLKIKTKDAHGNLLKMPDILAEVAKKTEKMGSADRLAIFTKIAGLRAGTAMAELVDKGGAGEIVKFTKILQDATGISKKMAAEMDDNTAGSILRLKSVWEALSISLFDSQGGVLKGFIDKLSEVVGSVKNWTDKNPKLASTLAGILGSVAAITTGLGGLLIVVAGMLAPLAILKRTMGFLGVNSALLTGKTGMLTGAFKLFKTIFIALGRAFLMNPIGLVITAVIALTYGAYQLITNWESVKAFFVNLWPRIKEGAVVLWQDIKAGASVAWHGITAVFSNIGSWFAEKWQNVKLGASLIWTDIKASWAGVKEKFLAFGSNIIDGLKQGISNKVTAIKEKITSIGTNIKSWFKGVLGINSPSVIFAGFGGNLMQGLINGMGNMLKKVKDKIMNIGSSVASWFKDKLGINSPSRVFVGFGGSIPEGLAKGIDKQSSIAQSSIGQLAHKIPKAFNKKAKALALASSLAVAPNLVMAAPIPAVNANQANNQQAAIQHIKIEVSVSISGNQDPKAIGQQIAQQVRDAMQQQKRGNLYDE